MLSATIFFTRGGGAHFLQDRSRCACLHVYGILTLQIPSHHGNSVGAVFCHHTLASRSAAWCFRRNNGTGWWWISLGQNSQVRLGRYRQLVDVRTIHGLIGLGHPIIDRMIHLPGIVA